VSEENVMRGWPAGLVAIADIIGTGAALKLVDAYGGQECYVPACPPPEHPVAQAIGLTAARALGKHFGGEHITVPNLAGLRYRKHLIAMAPGKTADVARRFAVTTRWVRAVRNAGAADPRQIEMFVDPDPGDGTGSV
jgi:hypothetical protein